MKLSNSALDLYSLCPKKYFFHYIQGFRADVTHTPLLFGTAIDYALNYILESIRDKKEWSSEEAHKNFEKMMFLWKGQNRLDFFKNEAPEEIQDSLDYDSQQHQYMVFNNIIERGHKCLDVYIKEVIPLFDEILHVQHRFNVDNEESDKFTGIIDFVAKLKDGRVVLFDNKTSSAKYPKNRVINSQQLSFYMDQFPDIKLAGYIVLIKNPEREKGLTFQVLVDEIPEETIAKSFKLLDETIQNIKQEKFPCNYKGCKAFGKQCVYEMLCQYGDTRGLTQLKSKSEEILDNEPKV